MSFTYKSILPTPEQIKGEFPLASEYVKMKEEIDRSISDGANPQEVRNRERDVTHMAVRKIE